MCMNKCAIVAVLIVVVVVKITKKAQEEFNIK